MAYVTSAHDFFVSNSPQTSPEPFVSRAKASPAKRREKGYGDENEVISFPDLLSSSTRDLGMRLSKTLSCNLVNRTKLS